jgi:hypothetical protein
MHKLLEGETSVKNLRDQIIIVNQAMLKQEKWYRHFYYQIMRHFSFLALQRPHSNGTEKSSVLEF